MASGLGTIPPNETNTYKIVNLLRRVVEAILTGQIPGTITSDDALTGNIGEYTKSSLAVGSAKALTTNSVISVVSVSITGGDWQVWGNGFLNPDAATTTTGAILALSTTSNALPSAGTDSNYHSKVGIIAVPLAGFVGAGTGGNLTVPAGPARFNIASTASPTTVFFVAQATFSGGANRAYGQLSARRVR